MTIYGYSRLVGYDPALRMEPDILESVDILEDRVYTFHLREAHYKWSDGSPLTTEDFRYTFEDVLSNEDISSGGLPLAMKVAGKGPVFEILDEHPSASPGMRQIRISCPSSHRRSPSACCCLQPT